jgi:hypothetical protein
MLALARPTTKEDYVTIAGDIIESPITGGRIAFFETARDTGGELLRLKQ